MPKAKSGQPNDVDLNVSAEDVAAALGWSRNPRAVEPSTLITETAAIAKRNWPRFDDLKMRARLLEEIVAGRCKVYRRTRADEGNDQPRVRAATTTELTHLSTWPAGKRLDPTWLFEREDIRRIWGASNDEAAAAALELDARIERKRSSSRTARNITRPDEEMDRQAARSACEKAIAVGIPFSDWQKRYGASHGIGKSKLYKLCGDLNPHKRK